VDNDKVLKPEPILEKEWDWYKEEFTGKLVPTTYERNEELYRCMTCGMEIFMDNYCSKCGQKLR
jgi:hypothetical protein